MLECYTCAKLAAGADGGGDVESEAGPSRIKVAHRAAALCLTFVGGKGAGRTRGEGGPAGGGLTAVCFRRKDLPFRIPSCLRPHGLHPGAVPGRLQGWHVSFRRGVGGALHRPSRMCCLRALRAGTRKLTSVRQYPTDAHAYIAAVSSGRQLLPRSPVRWTRHAFLPPALLP